MFNLKGFAVGNGLTDYKYDVWPSFYDTTYNFDMISKELYDAITTNDCYFSLDDVIPHNNS